MTTGTKPRRQRAAAVTTPTPEAVFIATHQGKVDTSSEDLRDLLPDESFDSDVQGGRAEHTRPGLVTMYKPTPFGYSPRDIPETNMANAIRNGWKVNCPDCGGSCGKDPNSCSGRQGRAYRICPVAGCGKRVYDYQVVDEALLFEDDDDPNLIRDNAYTKATPELRTKAALDEHLLGYHPREARAAGLTVPGQREAAAAPGGR
jgi:hypothetical protein